TFVSYFVKSVLQRVHRIPCCNAFARRPHHHPCREELWGTARQSALHSPSTARRCHTPAPMPCTSLLDHLVCLYQQRRGERDPEGLRGLEVEHQLEFDGLLDGQVGRLGALQDLVHVGSDTPPTI